MDYGLTFRGLLLRRDLAVGGQDVTNRYFVQGGKDSNFRAVGNALGNC